MIAVVVAALLHSWVASGVVAAAERSGRAIRPTPFAATLNRYVRLRGQLLDELERRDPALLGGSRRSSTVKLRRYLKDRADTRHGNDDHGVG